MNRGVKVVEGFIHDLVEDGMSVLEINRLVYIRAINVWAVGVW